MPPTKPPSMDNQAQVSLAAPTTTYDHVSTCDDLSLTMRTTQRAVDAAAATKVMKILELREMILLKVDDIRDLYIFQLVSRS